MRAVHPLMTAVFAALALLCVVGCSSGTAEPDAAVEHHRRVVADTSAGGVGALDLLFVINDGASMGEEQLALTESSELFFEALAGDDGTLPSLHVGVVSTNLGTGPHEDIQRCGGNGDDGRFQGDPNGACEPPTQEFIVDVEDGGERRRNYTGTLADTFSCIARIGTEGCGFEQPLEAMRRALDGTHPEHAGFLRPRAHLAVVILSDDDDCSVFDPAMFDAGQDSLDDPLGPLSIFRCFEFGVACSPDAPRTTGTKSDCRPREDSPFMTPSADYVRFLGDLRPPGRLFVAGITAPTEPVEVYAGAEGRLGARNPICDDTGWSVPGVRVRAFVNGFPGRSAAHTSCAADYSGTLTALGEALDRALGSRCLQGPLRDSDPESGGLQPACEATADGAPLPRCEGASPPCYSIAPSETCSETETGLAVQTSGTADARLIVRCELESGS